MQRSVIITECWGAGVVICLERGADLPSVLWCCWLGGRNGIGPVKTEWWGTGVVIWLEWGADLHMAQLMPLPLTVSSFSKTQIGLPFWYWLTRVVPEKGSLNVCVYVCLLVYLKNYMPRLHKLYLHTVAVARSSVLWMTPCLHIMAMHSSWDREYAHAYWLTAAFHAMPAKMKLLKLCCQDIQNRFYFSAEKNILKKNWILRNF